MQTKRVYSPIIISALLLSLGCMYLMQSFYFLNSDVSWLLTCTRRMLNGGLYSNDFFETNPPLILFLYSPIIFICKLLPLNITLVAKLYFMLGCLVSFAICYPLIEKIFHDQPLLGYWFSALLLASFFCLPAREYGQREHILMLFSMPYLLSMAYQWQGQSISQNQAILYGLMAGIGFALKPFYLAAFIGVEAYNMWKQRAVLSCLRTETYTIAAFFVWYAFVMILFFRDYLFVMVPFVSRYYYQGYSGTWQEIIGTVFGAYVGLLSLLTLIKRRQSCTSILTVLLIMYTTLYLCYVMQLNERYYKIIPEKMSEILILGILLWQYLEAARNNTLNYTEVVLTSLVFAAFLSDALPVANLLTQLKLYYFLFYAVQLLVFYYYIFYLQRNCFVGSMRRTVLIIGAGVGLSYLLSDSILDAYLWLIIAIVIVCLFRLALPATVAHRNKFLAAFIVTNILFAYPAYWLADIYIKAMNLPDMQNRILSFLQHNEPGKSVYFVSGANFTYPTIDYDKVESASRFPYYWMMSGILRAEMQHPHDARVIKDRAFFMNMIASDLEQRKPDLLFIINNDTYDSNVAFNYIQYFFREDARLINAFKHYVYVNNQSLKPYYDFSVYQRVDDKVANN